MILTFRGGVLRRRTGVTSLLGTVAHECSLTPVLSSPAASAAYARIMRERQRKAAEPRRTLKRLEVDDATANRLASGVGVGGIKARAATFAVSFAAASPRLSLSLSTYYRARWSAFGNRVPVPWTVCRGVRTRRRAMTPPSPPPFPDARMPPPPAPTHRDRTRPTNARARRTRRVNRRAPSGWRNLTSSTP